MRAMRCIDMFYGSGFQPREDQNRSRQPAFAESYGGHEMPLPREMMCDIEKTFYYDV